MSTKQDRPKLTDPEEWKIIRKIYFKSPFDENKDVDEQLERQEKKDKNGSNQAR